MGLYCRAEKAARTSQKGPSKKRKSKQVVVSNDNDEDSLAHASNNSDDESVPKKKRETKSKVSVTDTVTQDSSHRNLTNLYVVCAEKDTGQVDDDCLILPQEGLHAWHA